MPRVKGGTVARARRKKIMKMAKGFFGSKHRLYRTANEQVMRSLRYAYRDRRQNKRMFRRLWIERINAGCREYGLSYSKFIHGLKLAGVEVDRKMLSQLAIMEPTTFKNTVIMAKNALGIKTNDKIEISAPVKKEASKKESVKKETGKTDYTKMTVADLKALAKAQNISGYSTMKKDELLKVIK